MGVMTRLLLLLWVGVTASTVVDLQKRIIGGQVCGPAERPYHVEVRNYDTSSNEDFSYCGGSLISNQWILTATHCWKPARIMRAVLGIHPGAKATLEEITPHFFFDDQNMLHDIMLLKLTNPTQIKPVLLPNCGPPNPLKPGDTVEIAGYGPMTMGLNKEREPSRAPALQCANTMVVDCQDLINCLAKNHPKFHASIIYQQGGCFQSHGVDMSHGDSGGGVVFNGRIYGVISFMGNPDYACVEAAGFMDVCAYRAWINRIAGTAIA